MRLMMPLEKNGYHNEDCCCYVPSKEEQQQWIKNEKKYQMQILSMDEIKLLVVGNTPYECGFNGIAFCKDSWKELLDTQCSARYLLCSLGVNLRIAQSKYTNPVDLFMAMAQKGLIFFNQRDIFLKESLNKAPNYIISCGSNILKSVKQQIERKSGCFKYISRHPCPQGESNPPNKTKDWFKYWGKFESMLNILEPKNSNGEIHSIIKELNQEGKISGK